MSSKRKPTRTAKVAGGNNRSFSLDAATEARIAYLVAFYRDVLNVKTSGSGIVRRAVAELTARAEDIVRLKRGETLADTVAVARADMRQAVEGAQAPWPAKALESATAESFPTCAELAAVGKTKQELADEALAEVRAVMGRGN